MIAVYLRVSAISWRAGKSLTYVRYTACSPLVLILSHQLAQALNLQYHTQHHQDPV